MTAHILVVDDDPDILDSLRLVLESEDYEVSVTDKAEYAESLHNGDESLPDLIVLDVLLSGKDGRDICRRLKGRDDTRHIPIVMISAHPGAEASVRSVGADAFIPKPFTIDALVETVERLLATRGA